ncbi:MAG: class I SAM-dependent methyltransferase [Rhodanobacteraceae bacterium]
MTLRPSEWLGLLRPFARHLPGPIKEPLRRLVGERGTRTLPGDSRSQNLDYATRIAEESSIFANQIEIHDLPPIFHYWSNTWLRPKLEASGFSNPDEFFALYLERTHAEVAGPIRVASLGCGNCDTEVRVARLLVDRGLSDFVIDCIDINQAMLDRGRKLAAQIGVAERINPSIGDFNSWRPHCTYDGIMANQSLHHVSNLEDLFATIESALTAGGRFITSDMIGRNGHMRWPEALTIVHEFWRELPCPYRWNTQLKRHEQMYENWDCSNEGFEGIRAQDILPLLVERFDFELFIGYGNVIDPFIDRGFGPNFDAGADWDRDFIDRVHSCDETEIRTGRITPTHMMAVTRKRRSVGHVANQAQRDAEASIRRP